MTMHTSSNAAIVTGAARGIGAAIVRRLAGDGLAVIVNYASSAGKAEALAADICAQGGRALAVKADVTVPEQAADLFSACEGAFGTVRVLVNNAGLMQPGMVPLAQTDDTLFDRIVSTNIKGVFNMLRLAAARMQEGGRIINLSTSVNRLALPGYAIYAATKSAVETMTGIFSKELRGRDITVNAVGPGPTDTDLFFEGKTEGQVEAMAKLPPLERLAQPEDIASVVAFLAGRDGGWINGQTIRANGGMV
ncbi:SDR family oxidoreductase [Desulfovibrio desulfuricans]|uniref:SDR family oxidoreductase n=1 Tax=Desulfovibrio desulfuricans TaxID=876 RepID=UPI001CE12741|nr:SDR family oxidoreductase [Desulfovibrio desulfuricans]